MAFFVGQREQGRSRYYNVSRARRIEHDQTSVDRARWIFEFGFFTRKVVIVQRDTQASAYDRINSYFLDNSTGV